MCNLFLYDFWSVFFDVRKIFENITDELTETALGLNDLSIVT